MNFEKWKRAYQYDSTVHHVVNELRRLIEDLRLTPSEVREIAMFAACIHEMENPKSQMIFMGKEKDLK